MSLLNIYAKKLKRLFDEIIRRNHQAIRKSVDLLSRSITKGGLIHMFGTGHSSLACQDAFFRAGGIMQVSPILEPDFMAYKNPLRIVRNERDMGLAKRLLKKYRVRGYDSVIMISNSGRNPLTVELAMLLKKKGVKIIAITNIKHTSSVTSLHPAGKKLCDIADIVIDNCGVAGDTLLRMRGQQFGPASSICAMFIVNVLIVGLIEKMIQKHKRIDILKSVNLQGSELASLKKLVNKYSKRIPWLKS